MAVRQVLSVSEMRPENLSYLINRSLQIAAGDLNGAQPLKKGPWGYTSAAHPHERARPSPSARPNSVPAPSHMGSTTYRSPQAKPSATPHVCYQDSSTRSSSA